MFEVQINTEVKITVILVNLSTGTPRTGVDPADVVLYYRKAGGIPILKSLTSANFAEVEGTLMPGLYEITFTPAEMDTAGEFVAVVQENAVENLEQSNILFRVSTLLEDLLLEIRGPGFSAEEHSLEVLRGAVDSRASSSALDDMQEDVTLLREMCTRLLGLSQENIRITDQIYDVNNNLIASTLRHYASAADTVAEENPVEEYSLSATYDASNRLIDYRIVRVGS